METCCDCPLGDDMMDIDDGPVPVHESTGLGQTESDSNWNLHYSDSYEEVFPGDKDTSTQSKSGEPWKMPSFRKPRDRRSSWSETSTTASSSSSRRSSRSRSDNRKGDRSRGPTSPPAGSNRKDLDDVFTFDKPGPSRRRNSVPGMFAPPGPASSRRRNSGPGMFDPTSSQRRNSVPCAGSSNSRSQWSSDENLASEFESKLSHLFPSSNQFATFSSLLFQRRFFNCTISNG